MAYREQPRERGSWQVSWRNLSPKTQKNIEVACQPSSTVLHLARRSPNPAMLVGVSVVCFAWAGALVCTAVSQLAVLHRGLSEPVESFPLWIAMVVMSGSFGAITALRARKLRRMPLSPGIYVLQKDLVDARTPILHLHSLASLESVRKKRQKIELCFEGGHSYQFDLHGNSYADLFASLQGANGGSDGELVRSQLEDPFAEESRASWEQPQTGFVRKLSEQQDAWGIWLLISVALGQVAYRGTHRVLDDQQRQSIELAFERKDVERLQIGAQGSGSVAALADQRWLALAVEAPRNDELIGYLQGGKLLPQAEAALLTKTKNCAGLQGKHDCDRALKVAERSLLRKHWLRSELLDASQSRNLAALRSWTHGSLEMKEEANAYLASLYDVSNISLDLELPRGSTLAPFLRGWLDYSCKQEEEIPLLVRWGDTLAREPEQREVQRYTSAILLHEIRTTLPVFWLLGTRPAEHASSAAVYSELLLLARPVPDAAERREVYGYTWRLNVSGRKHEASVNFPRPIPLPVHDEEYFSFAATFRAALRASLIRTGG